MQQLLCVRDATLKMPKKKENLLYDVLLCGVSYLSFADNSNGKHHLAFVFFRSK